MSALTGLKFFFHNLILMNISNNTYVVTISQKKCNAVEIDKIFSKIVSFYLRVITDYPINLNYGKT